MIIINALNSAIRTACLGVAFPFRAAGRMLYRSACGIVLACIAIRDGITGSIRAMGRGIRRTVHGTGVAVAFVWGPILRIVRGTRHVIATGAVNAARLAAMPFIAIYRAFVSNLASTAMTLSLEDGHARLLVLKGRRVIAWRAGQIAQRPEETAADPANATGAGKRAEKPGYNPLETLLEGLPARSRRVVADLPLHVPLLRHVPIPDVKRRYIKNIVNNEVLDSVPFAADEMDIRWRIEPGDDVTEASVIAVPRDRMDEQAGIVRDSRLVQSAVYPKAAALAAAVARPDVFILHMTQGQTAVILVRGGVPRIVHRLELPQETTAQAEVIAMGVEQVAGYHRSQRPDDDVAGLPVVVTGELEPVQDLVGLLATTLDRPLLPFEPDLEYPEGFDPAGYAANIGLFLASRSRGSGKVIAAQNVLPERYLPWRFPVAATAVFAGLLALGYLAFTVTGLVSGVAGELDPLNARVELMESQAREYRLTAAKHRVFERGIADIDLEITDLEANQLLLEKEMDTLLARINDITGNAGPSDVALVWVGPRPDGFSVSGKAETYSDVLGYAASMRSSPNFEDAMVVQVSDPSGSQVAFTVEMIVAKPEPEEDEEPAPQAQSP